jgi:hypothetical protein
MMVIRVLMLLVTCILRHVALVFTSMELLFSYIRH